MFLQSFTENQRHYSILKALMKTVFSICISSLLRDVDIYANKSF